ncbi:MAG: kua-ubiquitin conjugating enzyme hybrid localization domain protein [Leptospiraceae bacterium]|nr:kua-ubiquitin conjugating enzyme hybrid localization domain protein [Leptospiraceae bacterium]MCB1317754.1 kua-ubiquitin conjugating enzyme hybrid localization domain protein [Leptospiraceae bacterium]
MNPGQENNRVATSEGEHQERSVGSFYRFLEWFAIITFPMALVGSLYIAFNHLIFHHAWWVILPALLAGYLLGDFISGFVHWFFDTFGKDTLPFIGKAIIEPFRVHHVRPEEITWHDFGETNGNSFLLGLVFIIPVYWICLTANPGDFWAVYSTLIILLSAVFSICANQIHKWSHMEAVPGFIAWMQKYHLILNPAHHDKHHTAPFDRNYCISCGWMNHVLDAMYFWRFMEFMLGLFGMQNQRILEQESAIRMKHGAG